MKYLKSIILFIFLISMCLLLTGCGKTDNTEKETELEKDENEITGYSYVETIVCDAFEKDIIFINKDIFITSDSEAYAYNIEKQYSNGTNGAKFEDSVKLVLISNKNIFEEDKKVTFNVTDVTLTKSDYSALDGKDVKPVKEAGYYIYMNGPAKGNNKSTLYGIKKNTNILYSFTLGIGTEKDKNGMVSSNRFIENEQIDYSVPEDEIIISFLYSSKEEDYLKDYIRTNKSIYKRRIVNAEESEQYVDVKREYEWYKDETLSKIVDKIVYFDDVKLITKDGKVYNKI